jgi:phenylacetate-CoA ligase
MTEVGPLGFESADSPGGMLLLENRCIPEVIDPATGCAAPAGATGELVITTLYRTGSPLLRYRTGDLVKSPAAPSPLPTSDLRLPTFLAGGILGRLDDMILVRGNNVYPSALEAVLKRIPQVAEYHVHVHPRGGPAADLRLSVEAVRGADGEMLRAEVRRAVQDALCFRPEVEIVAPGSLPRFEMKAKRFTYHDF